MTATAPQTGYAPVNGLQMYYEVHGAGEGDPLVLVHGAFSAIGTSFGALLPGLARGRRVIAVELQGHGRTADIDRPMTLEALADDVVALLRYLNVARADLFGYSMGSGVVLRVAVRHPEVVRKLVLASVSYTLDGLHPGLMEGLGEMKPEMMYGSPWHEEYVRIAPHPDRFDALFAKKSAMDKTIKDLAPETLRAITVPTLTVVGDADIVRPEHAVAMFRLFGGGVVGDLVGIPRAQLAVLPGTSHTGVVERAGWLTAMVPAFLDAPVPAPTPAPAGAARA